MWAAEDAAKEAEAAVARAAAADGGVVAAAADAVHGAASGAADLLRATGAAGATTTGSATTGAVPPGGASAGDGGAAVVDVRLAPSPPPIPFVAGSTITAIRALPTTLGFTRSTATETTTTMSPAAALAAWEEQLRTQGFLVASTQERTGARVVAHGGGGDAEVIVGKTGPPTTVIVHWHER